MNNDTIIFIGVVSQTPTISTNTDTLNSQSLTKPISIIRFLILFTVAK